MEISRITASALPAVQEWRNRPLEAVYPFVFLDCMFFKVRVNGAVEAISPRTRVQLCVVRQIRSSMKYVPYRDKKTIAVDMKPIYKENNEQKYEKNN